MLSIRSQLATRFELAGLLADSTAGLTYVAHDREGQTGISGRSRDTTVFLQFVGWQHSRPRQRERFLYEIRALAQYPHPNLLPVREVLDGDDGLLLVYDYFAGQTLAQMLANGAIPANHAAACIIQLADVLEAAHRQGIVHGGVDPSTVLIAETGLVKLFGFGSAALRMIEDEWQFHGADPHSPEHQALERVRLRRAGYRAPECIAGQTPDSRSDVFSLGCLFYELLSGKRAFARKNSELTLRAVTERPPRPIDEVAQGVPAEMVRVLRRCLRKDPDRRYQHMLDLKLDLQEQREDLEFAEILSTVEMPGAPRIWWVLPVLAVLAIVAYFGGHRVLFRAISPKRPPPPVVSAVTSGDTLSRDPAISADGSTLVFSSDRGGDNLDIYIQSVADGAVRRITSDAADERDPTLSPDGRTIAWRSERLAGGIYTAPADGSSAPRWIANQGRRPRYSPDGSRIAFWARTLQNEDVGAIYVIPAAGGAPRQLASDFYSALYPVWSADGGYLLFLGSRTKGDPLDFWVTPASGGVVENLEAYRIVRRWFLSAIVPDAWVNDTLYFTARAGRHTSLWKLRVPMATRRAEGDSQRILDGEEDFSHASVSNDGHLYFSSTRDSINLWMAPLNAESGRITGAPERFYVSGGLAVRPSLSHDGRWLAFTSDRNGQQNVWLRDMETGSEEPVTANPYRFFTPTGVLTPDGKWLAYTQWEQGKTIIYLRGTQGGAATMLCEDCETPRDWSSDGNYLLYSRSSHNYSIGMVERGTGVRTLLAQSDRFPILSPRFGPGNRWIAFHAMETPDVRKVVALAIAGTSSAAERQWIPITSGGILDRGAQWSPEGNLMYFMSERDGNRSIYAQRLDQRTRKPAGQPFAVFESKAARRSLRNVPRGYAEMIVQPGRLVFTMGELSGNIFVAEPVNGESNSGAAPGAPR
ncbi:MAG: PD40 domain-containing protein [Bryobacterales bacterium]|nr:PD40 domain-containing protein [Bryobacterales bacterium]